MIDSKVKFLWGVSTSSYQVEGGISNNDWDYFARSDSIKKRISSLTKPSKFIYSPQVKQSNSGSRNIMKKIFN